MSSFIARFLEVVLVQVLVITRFIETLLFLNIGHQVVETLKLHVGALALTGGSKCVLET